jgi:leader peptidase (prepilin peptidase)/N-methyltransferase
LVEILTGLIFFLTFKVFFESMPGIERWLTLVTHLISWPLLIVMLVYDFRHKIIPDAFVYAFALVALAYRLFISYLHGFSMVPVGTDLAAGVILFTPFFLLWFLSRGKWMGLGDGKLALGIGWLLGLGGGISAVLLGFWLGAAVGLLAILVVRLRRGSKTLTMKSEIPFGPFLIAGIFAVSFLNFSLFTLFSP